MFKNPLITIFILLSATIVFAQQDDGLNDREISTYSNNVETARNTVIFKSGFSTVGNGDLHAYIDPLIPQGGYKPGLTNMNFIRVFTPLKNNKTTTEPTHETVNYDDWSETTQYFDGLGRAIQTVQSKASPSGKDIIQPIVYDQFGRQTKQFLPYTYNQDAVETTGAYRPQAAFQTGTEYEQENFYNAIFPNEPAFAETRFDNSPLNRTMEQGAVGEEWQIIEGQNNHTVEYEYTTNTSSFNRYIVNENNELERASDYEPNELYITRVTDENENVVEEYKNKLGQVIATGTVGQELTYSVFDDFGKLRYTIPPLAYAEIKNNEGVIGDIETPIIKNLCYYYEYDGRKRMIIKKLPGADTIKMIYNKRDQLVITQDGNQRQNNEYSFTKYDCFGRPIITGIFQSLPEYCDFECLKGLVNDQTTQWETYDTETHEYSNNTVPTNIGNRTEHTFTYYDNYDYAVSQLDYQYEQYNDDDNFDLEESNKTKGMPTCTKTRVLGENKWLHSVIYYDDYGRTIQTISENNLDGYDRISMRYNFAGELLETVQARIMPAPNKEVTITENYTYDRMSRPLKTTHKINDQATVTLTELEYNEIGQLTSKKLHSQLQTINYNYNIRGWTTDITSPHFTTNLDYTDQYNGNIHAITWHTSTFPEPKTYTFEYDNLNRLLSANYSGINDYSSSYRYDLNGNMEELTRYGELSNNTLGKIDKLDYTYFENSNQLKKVNDQASQSIGFSDNGATLENDYAYDQNGNLTKDLNKQITNIQYNNLNLPKKIELYQDYFNEIYYLYTADGTKLQVKTYKDELIQKTTNYTGNIIYDGNEISYIITAEGRLTPKEETFEYEYYLTDHLGNTRVVLDQSGAVLQTNSYYPFGMIMEGLTTNNQTLNPKNLYLYNGKELQEDFGLNWHDYGFRMYDAQIGRWHVIDPMAEQAPNWTPYRYAFNNPLKFIDPDGRFESTLVTELDDGTYKVVGGDANDGDNGIYIANSSGEKGELIGYSATPYSFFHSESGKWYGTIDPNDQSGRNFLNNEILDGNPDLIEYMTNATGGEKWDFKVTNATGENYTERTEHYRGMPILGKENGLPIFASARDVGNIAAGYVASKSGLSWTVARVGLDGLETYQTFQNKGIIQYTKESASTQYAEKLGHSIGVNIRNSALKKARLPGDGGVSPKIPNMIKLNEL